MPFKPKVPCVRCMKNGRYVRATVVDHIKPHCGDQRLFWDEDNWQALCKECHNRKTLTEDISLCRPTLTEKQCSKLDCTPILTYTESGGQNYG